MRLDVGVNVDASVETTFGLWQQFEKYDRFLEGVVSVRPAEDGRLIWRLDRRGEIVERACRITENSPHKVLCWESEADLLDSVKLVFSQLESGATAIKMQITFDPRDYAAYREDHQGGILGYVGERAHADLARFKSIVESMCPSLRRVHTLQRV